MIGPCSPFELGLAVEKPGDVENKIIGACQLIFPWPAQQLEHENKTYKFRIPSASCLFLFAPHKPGRVRSHSVFVSIAAQTKKYCVLD